MLVGNTFAAETERDPSDRARTVVKIDPRSGRLVRKVVAPSAQPAQASESIAQIVDETARTHHVDPLLVHSVIQVESNYNRFALSPKGAEGLMQLIPSTARRFGVTDSFDPKQNIEAGVKYLKYLQTLFKDDRLALAAYNAGEGAVGKYKDVPPYKETAGYVVKVGKKLTEARAHQAQSTPAKVEETPAEQVESHPVLEQYTDAHGRLHLRTRSGP
jgi:soluble lytic murein transglycosylase-like protein